MTQLAFDFDLLDDSKQHEMYPCGKHAITRDLVAHWEDCCELTCPRCGEVSRDAFTADRNHGLIAWRMFCYKQIAYLNHAARCHLILTGEWKHDPQTNCYVHPHPELKNGYSYFPKGAPMACIQDEFDQKKDWLVSHRVEEDWVGRLGQFNANTAAAA